MLAKNSLLALVAASASSFAFAKAISESFRSVISLEIWITVSSVKGEILEENHISLPSISKI